MTLTPETKLGGYEILSQLGAGGMGEVYKALDTKLGRDVAIKVVPDAFSNDEERLDPAHFRGSQRKTHLVFQWQAGHLYFQ